VLSGANQRWLRRSSRRFFTFDLASIEEGCS
jgi:hypothetical protein